LAKKSNQTIPHFKSQAGEFNMLSYTEEVGLADYGLKNYKLVKLVAAKK
jgi:hypothetical protein